MQFQSRPVGRTGVQVSALGLGCATLAGNLQPVSDMEARLVVLAALDAGITYFDTAPFYGLGRSEHVVGDELRNRTGWILSTKVGRVLKHRRTPHDPGIQWKNPFPFDPVFDYSYDGIMRGYEDSLQRLALPRIDIAYIHDIDVYSHGSKEKQEKVFRQAMTETYRALDELRRNGDIKAIGLGVNEAGPIIEALDHGSWDAFLLAGRYTLLEQEPLHTVFPAIEKHGASVVIGGPFNSGILAGGEHWNYARAPEAVVQKVRRMEVVCAAHNTPLAAAALQFPVAHNAVASVVPGPRSAAELNQIIDWWQTPVPAGLWRDLKSEGLLDRNAPVPT